MNLWLKLPPRLFVYPIIVFSTIMVIWRFFTSTIFGFFLLIISLYILLFQTSFKPFTPSELVSFISSLDKDYKIAIFTSVLTIAGFLIAFYAAAFNLRQQMNAQFRARTAEEIEEFYNEVLNLIRSTEIYVKSLISAVEEIQRDGITDHTEFSVKYVVQRVSQFESNRSRLSTLSSEAYRIVGKNNEILSNFFSAKDDLEIVNKALKDISEKMWIAVPPLSPDNPNYDLFVSQANMSKYKDFIACCERNVGIISGVTGGVRGVLLSGITEFNLPKLISFIKNRKDIQKSIEEIRDRLQKLR
jgi:hypothetical protein